MSLTPAFSFVGETVEEEDGPLSGRESPATAGRVWDDKASYSPLNSGSQEQQNRVLKKMGSDTGAGKSHKAPKPAVTYSKSQK